MGSGRAPPPAYAFFSARARSVRISASGRDWPRGFAAAYRHCIQRPLLTMLPSFSTAPAAGSRNTSVRTSAGFTPGRFQWA